MLQSTLAGRRSKRADVGVRAPPSAGMWLSVRTPVPSCSIPCVRLLFRRNAADRHNDGSARAPSHPRPEHVSHFRESRTRVVPVGVVFEALTDMCAWDHTLYFGKGLAPPRVDGNCRIGKGRGGFVPRACYGLTLRSRLHTVRRNAFEGSSTMR
jgi:hypothetical protein